MANKNLSDSFHQLNLLTKRNLCNLENFQIGQKSLYILRMYRKEDYLFKDNKDEYILVLNQIYHL